MESLRVMHECARSTRTLAEDVDTPSKPEGCTTTPSGGPEPRILSRGAFRLAGLRYCGRNEKGEVPAIWDLFLPRLGELGPARAGIATVRRGPRDGERVAGGRL